MTPSRVGAFPTVVAGVLKNRRQELLISRRPLGKPYAGYWEFPGGKVEQADTSPLGALKRELHEELGITLDLQAVTYLGEAKNSLGFSILFYGCRGWGGAPKGRENQLITWVPIAHLTRYQLLPTNFALFPVFEAFSRDAPNTR